MKKIFEVRKHEEWGTLGMIEVSAPPNFEPLEGMGIAHDCLEHFPADDGSIDHEFQALGCALWLRGSTGYFNAKGNSNPPEVHIASDISFQLWQHYINGTPMRPPQLHKLKYEDLIIKAVEATKKSQLSDRILEDHPGDQKAFLASAKYWMQVGYRRAKQRYPDPWRVIQIFQKIEERVDQELKHGFEGQRFEIQYNLKTLMVTVKELMLEEDYY